MPLPGLLAICIHKTFANIPTVYPKPGILKRHWITLFHRESNPITSVEQHTNNSSIRLSDSTDKSRWNSVTRTNTTYRPTTIKTRNLIRGQSENASTNPRNLGTFVCPDCTQVTQLF